MRTFGKIARTRNCLIHLCITVTNSVHISTFSGFLFSYNVFIYSFILNQNAYSLEDMREQKENVMSRGSAFKELIV